MSGAEADTMTVGGTSSEFSEAVVREVTSWEGVTTRRGRFGTVEFRLGSHVLGLLPLAGLVDAMTVVARMREAYDRAASGLDRRAGLPA